MTPWQRFLRWCSEADRYPHIKHVRRDGSLASFAKQEDKPETRPGLSLEEWEHVLGGNTWTVKPETDQESE